MNEPTPTPPHCPTCAHIRESTRPDLSKYLELALYNFENGRVSFWDITTLDDRLDYWNPLIAALEYKAWMMEARRLSLPENQPPIPATFNELTKHSMAHHAAIVAADAWVQWESQQ